jgi:hypothetical protein
MAKEQNDEKRRKDSAQPSSQEPPQPPPFAPALRITPFQLIGIALLALLPLLALFGFFDANHTTERASNGEVALQVEYASLHQYRMREEMMVTVTNLSQQSPITINISFERGFIDHFTEITFVPDIETVSTDGFDVQLSEVASGETRMVYVELKGQQLWRRTGVISASIDGGQPVSVTVRTWILP